MNSYLTLVLKSAGYGTFQTNLLTIPAYVLFIINLLFWTWLSEKLNDRFLIGTISQIWVLPLLIALETLPTTRSSWVTRVLSIMLYGQPYVHAILVATTSRNAGSVRTRTVASALYNMSIVVLIRAQIYRTPDKPYYFTGNKVLIGLSCWSFALFIFAKFFYLSVNRRRERKWTAMSRQEKEHYLTTTEDKGNKRLDFRFSH
ncbi:hypothetical protein LTR53_017680 [Teratosphaeriaceae sp. CCFEE 6253]|nr:hypothetical protein LTR53_017680 [Teratosphaeriaceae sp. CCFEE 6253]